MTTSGGLGETEGGGPSLNILPKEGGNAVRGTFFAAGATGGMIGSNYTQELQDRGLTTPGETRKVWDFNLGIGGPVARDRLWFYANIRDEGSERTVPGMFANANAGDPTKWTYVADTSRPAVLAASYRITALRLTGQATPRNKFTLFWDQQRPCEGGAAQGFSGNACRMSGDGEVFAGSTAAPTPSASAMAAPETAGYRDYGNRVSQAKWTSPVNNRLLLEAGLRHVPQPLRRRAASRSPHRGSDSRRGDCAGGCAANGNIAGLSYRSLNWFSNINWNNQWNAAASLVTGSHSIKVGYQGAMLIDQRKNFGNNQFVQYRVNNAVPDQITLNINRFGIEQTVRSDAFYAQEQWTLGRMTVQGAVRYDRAWSYFPEQTVGPVRFFPTAVTYPRTTGVEGYNDLWPRAGIAYDVFGTGKTSVKFNFGRYLEAAQNSGFFIALNPTRRLSTTTTSTWTDDDRDFVADCNLENGAAQGTQTAAGGVPTASISAEPMRAPTSAPRCSTRPWTRACCRGGACARATGSAARRCSRKCCRASRSKWDTSAGGSSTPSSPTTARGHPRTTPSSASRSPRISRLPDGGGGVLEGLYNVTPAAATRLTDNYDTLVLELCRLVAPVQLGQPERDGADAQRPDGAGRVQHRDQQQRLLRREGCHSRVDGHPGAVTDQPVVRHVVGMGHAHDRAGLVHDSEGRGAGLRHAAQRSGRPAGRELDVRRTAPPSVSTGRLPALAARRSP